MSALGEPRGAMVACVPVVTTDVAAGIARAGLRAVPATDPGAVAALHATESLGAVVVDGEAAPLQDALLECKAIRRLDPRVEPVVLVVPRGLVSELSLRDGVFDDFVVAPIDPVELAARLGHLLADRGAPGGAHVLERGALTIDVATYRAAIAGRVLDLTYMEYELLRFLAAHPEQVFTRETLLNRVWGYEYYGGARTVDVHVRRLRAKLGEEHAHLIETVRGVGYRCA